MVNTSTKSQTNEEDLRSVKKDDSRAPPDYGYIIFNVILNLLFPERWNIDDVSRYNCFEDGSFVFNDPNHQLFDILLGVNNPQIACTLNELSNKSAGKEVGVLDQMGEKSHFLLDQLSERRIDDLGAKYEFGQLFYIRDKQDNHMTTTPIHINYIRPSKGRFKRNPIPSHFALSVKELAEYKKNFMQAE